MSERLLFFYLYASSFVNCSLHIRILKEDHAQVHQMPVGEEAHLQVPVSAVATVAEMVGKVTGEMKVCMKLYNLMF